MANQPFRPIPPKILVAVAVVLLAEFASFIFLIVKAGFWPTVFAAAITGFIGMALAKRNGRVLFGGRPPVAGGEDLLDGVLGMFGGVLMLSPGFLLDALGLALQLKPVRTLVKTLIGGWIGAKVATMTQTATVFRSQRQTRDDNAVPSDVSVEMEDAEPARTPFAEETPFDRLKRKPSKA